jgi:flagellar biosynthesis regulator FlbT
LIKTKIVRHAYQGEFEKELNQFLATLKDDQIVDIKFTTTVYQDQDTYQTWYNYYALVVYRA